MYFFELNDIALSAFITLSTRQKELLDSINIRTVLDLLNYFPFRYEDRTQLEDIQTSLLEQRPVSCKIQIMRHDMIYFNKRRHPKIVIQDEKTQAFLIAFNRFYLQKTLEVGKSYYLYAQFQYKFNEIQANTFDFEEIKEGEESHKFKQILAVYRTPQKLKLTELRSMMQKVLGRLPDDLEDELPDYLLRQHNLISKRDALKYIHTPQKSDEIKKAKLRLSFESLFSLQLAVMLRRKMLKQINKNFHTHRSDIYDAFINALPFKLTAAQDRATQEIITDIRCSQPMHRLVQGDVGSGKTVVAFAAAAMIISNQGQCALMAPTEVLARQHYEGALKLLSPLGINIAYLSSALSKQEKMEVLDQLKSGSIDLITGTHALFQKDVCFKDLRLIIIDEQHKFGVRQRLALAQKAEHPDTLVMTATPIPRTITLTLYGDLDISIIDELPPGRQPVNTHWVKDKAAYQKMIMHVAREVEKGRQAYFIYPMIEESENSSMKSAVEMYHKIAKHFKQLKVGLIHGKMDPGEKDKIMSLFKQNRIHILVSTTVIEVGVDVPNASTIVIEDADHFGLSQLHQLRGRVGRGEFASSCFLICMENDNPDTTFRMKTMLQYQDGFKIAEADLKLRGPGEMMGTRQSGLPELRFAEYLMDEKLLMVARQDAQAILNKDPELVSEMNQTLKRGIIDPLPHSYLHSG